LQLDSGGDTADHSTATNTDQDAVYVRKVFEDLEAHSALAGDYGFVIVRWNQSVAVLGREYLGALFAFVARRSHFDYVGTQCFGLFQLQLRSDAGHHDRGLAS
jgi:hypothetical protein